MLLAKAGRPELKGLLGDFERRERALREAAWELRSLEACRATSPSRRNGGDDGPARQGVLPLPELNGTAWTTNLTVSQGGVPDRLGP